MWARVGRSVAASRREGGGGVFLIDDILLAPARGFLWLCRELQAAAEQAQAQDREGVMRRLQSLHMRLETGDITEAQFDEMERELLDQLDAMAGQASDPQGEDADDGDEEGDDGDADGDGTDPVAEDAAP